MAIVVFIAVSNQFNHHHLFNIEKPLMIRNMAQAKGIHKQHQILKLRHKDGGYRVSTNYKLDSTYISYCQD